MNICFRRENHLELSITQCGRVSQPTCTFRDLSPQELDGFSQGHRIIKVNGINIANENHKQVVERIKALSDETRLLVDDTDTDAWYQPSKS